MLRNVVGPGPLDGSPPSKRCEGGRVRGCSGRETVLDTGFCRHFGLAHPRPRQPNGEDHAIKSPSCRAGRTVGATSAAMRRRSVQRGVDHGQVARPWEDVDDPGQMYDPSKMLLWGEPRRYIDRERSRGPDEEHPLHCGDVGLGLRSR